MAATGVFKLDNGNWAFRIKNKDFNTTRHCDEFGNKLKTQKEAKAARARLLVSLSEGGSLNEIKKEPRKSKYTLNDVKLRYDKSGKAAEKAYSTIKKQNSMWNEHIKQRFADIPVNDFTCDMLYDFLVELYLYGDLQYVNERAVDKSPTPYSYKYVEGFLKFFYLLFGCASEYGYINNDRYEKMFVNKNTRLSMPKRTQIDIEEEEGNNAYTSLEIKRINDILRGSNLYTAFLIGYYTGVRISECFGLRWQNIDWHNSTITVNRQLRYDDERKIFTLGPVKTLTSKRIITMPKVLHNHLYEKYMFEQEQRKKYALGYRDNEKILDIMTKDNEFLLADKDRDFINRKENGELLTTNSFKAWSLEIEKQSGLDFEYHNLRRTHATNLVAKNIPIWELKNRMGHKKIDTTLSYYVKPTEEAKKITNEIINSLSIAEDMIQLDNAKVSSTLFMVLQEETNEKLKSTPVPYGA